MPKQSPYCWEGNFRLAVVVLLIGSQSTFAGECKVFQGPPDRALTCTGIDMGSIGNGVFRGTLTSTGVDLSRLKIYVASDDFNVRDRRNLDGQGNFHAELPVGSYTAQVLFLKPAGADTKISDVETNYGAVKFIISKESPLVLFYPRVKSPAPPGVPEKLSFGTNVPVLLVAGLVGNSGSGLVGNSGTALIGNSGSALVGSSGSGLVGNSGSALIGNSGAALIGNSGSALNGRSIQSLAPSLSSPSLGSLSEAVAAGKLSLSCTGVSSDTRINVAAGDGDIKLESLLMGSNPPNAWLAQGNGFGSANGTLTITSVGLETARTLLKSQANLSKLTFRALSNGSLSNPITIPVEKSGGQVSAPNQASQPRKGRGNSGGTGG